MLSVISAERKIFLALLKNHPITQAEIVRATGLSQGVVKYHIPRMVNKGILVKRQFRKRFIYSLQPLFHSTEKMTDMLEDFSVIIYYFGRGLISPDGKEVEDLHALVRNNMVLFLSTLDIEHMNEDPLRKAK
jgi:DNA-binding Lrp family transcriptional regulator